MISLATVNDGLPVIPPLPIWKDGLLLDQLGQAISQLTLRSPIRRCSNLWTALPTEIREHIYSFSDPLTQFLNRNLTTCHSKPLSSEEALQIWQLAFELDWEGDLDLLPSNAFPNAYTGLLLVRSRRMYQKLCELKPELTECRLDVHKSWDPENLPEKPFEAFDCRINKYNPDISNVLKEFHNKPLERLLHIPMYHGWIDILEETGGLPLALANQALYFGYPRLFKHIMNSSKPSIDKRELASRDDNLIDMLYTKFYWFGLGQFDFQRLSSFQQREDDILELLQFLDQLGFRPQDSHFADCCAAKGHLKIMKWLENEQGILFDASTMEAAAAYGHLEVVQYLHKYCDENYVWDDNDAKYSLSVAASRGHLEVVKWLSQYETYHVDETTMDDVARNGHLHVLQWLHQNRSEGCTANAIDSAAECGHSDIIRWLYDNRREGFTSDAISKAFANGHIDIVSWLLECTGQGDTDFPTNIDEACMNGHTDAVRWWFNFAPEYLYNSAVEHEVIMIDVAYLCKEGFLEILQILHTHSNLRISMEAVEAAALSGKLEVLQWIHQTIRFSFSVQVLNKAIEGGHLEVAKWLFKFKPDDFDTSKLDSDKAAARGHLEMVQWLTQVSKESFTSRAIDQAARRGHFQVVRYLYWHAKSGSSHAAIDKACSNGFLFLAKWLLLRGEKFTYNSWNGALNNGYNQCADWVDEVAPDILKPVDCVTSDDDDDDDDGN
ncbi:hypothetical protein HDV05_007478 [Chytridiales sp. JEL 0842]|nr:hypothetical protein HDV05_007478 [Chytridiales sp. JEL 0842]